MTTAFKRCYLSGFLLFLFTINLNAQNDDDFLVPLKSEFTGVIVEGMEIGKDYLMRVKLVDRNDTVTVISFANKPYMASDKSRDSTLHTVIEPLEKGGRYVFYVYWIGMPENDAFQKHIRNKERLYALIDGIGKSYMHYYTLGEWLEHSQLYWNNPENHGLKIPENPVNILSPKPKSFQRQVPESDSVVDVNDYLYNAVYKNIAAYNIRFSSRAINNGSFTNTFWGNAEFFYDCFLPDFGYKLKIDIYKLDYWKYPLASFDLYRIRLEGFNYEGPKGEPSLHCPSLFSFKDFLLGLNKRNGDIKFISGQFFTNGITPEFKTDSKNPSSFLFYLKYRSFYFGGKDIVFKKRKRGKLYFDGYSDVYQEKMRIIISLKDIEHTYIIVGKNAYREDK